MSISKAFTKHMQELTTQLTDTADVNKQTNTVALSLEKVTFPKGVTQESLGVHVNFINEVAAGAESVTADLARQMFKDNDKLTTVDSTLAVCEGLTIRSQHHLKQTLGDDKFLYGESTTSIDFLGTAEQAKWLNDVSEHNKELARGLFNK